MMPLTPKVGREIFFRALVPDGELSRYGEEVLSRLKERGAEQTILHIVNDCLTTKRDEKTRSTVLELMAVVASSEEWEACMRDAYNEGYAHGMRMSQVKS
jgi:hypothetical protein